VIRLASIISLKASILLTLVTLVLLVCGVLWQAYPSTEAVRLRNALLFEDPSPNAGNWSPADVPEAFKREQLQVPVRIAAVAAQIASAANGDLDLARALAAHLTEKAVWGGRVHEFEVDGIYREIVEEGRGYCADVVDAYVALALAADLFVRTWSFSFDGFGGDGHINVEVYDRAEGRWVMLDVFNNVMAIDRVTRQPLGAHEFRARFVTDRDSVEFIPVHPGRQRIPIYSKLVDYYARGLDGWYLWNGNNVVGRSDGAVVQAAARVGEPVAEFVAVMVGSYPRIVPLATDSNGAAIARMQRLGWGLRAALVVGLLLTALLVIQVGVLVAGRVRRPGRR